MRRALTDDAKDERCKGLLAAALDEFFERGFAAARMEDIALRASLSKGTIYLYFDSKGALFEALIENLATSNVKQIEIIAADASSLREALGQLARFAPVLIRKSNLPRLMKVLIGDSQTFPDIVRAYRQDNIDRVLRALKGILDRAAARGEIAVGDTDLVTRLIVAPIIFSGIWQAVFGRDDATKVDLESLFRMHADFLLKALAPGTQPC